jgi:MarR-like DNA-binding transcriptional regulator SgrR of sgrS sRNA
MKTLLALALLLFASTGSLHAAPEGTMTWGVHISLAARWLDPGEAEGVITPFMVLYALHDALMKPLPAGLSAPSLAASWTTAKDGLAYEFVLREGVKFHNGDPVTAEDVKFSFERYRGGAAKLLKERVREVQVIDPARVRFHMKEPWPDFMAFYGTTASAAGWIVPKKYIEHVGEEAFKKAPVGARPYRFVSFTPGVELVAFDGYWRKTPSVKRIVFKVMPRRDDAGRGPQEGRGRRHLPAHRSGGPRHRTHTSPESGVAAGFWRLLARLSGPVEPEVAVARQTRPSRGEHGNRSQGAEPGGDARLLTSDGLDHSPKIRVRAPDRTSSV